MWNRRAAVLDGAGNPTAFAREDGSGLLRERIARKKAFGALGMGSCALATRAQSHPQFVNALITLAEGSLMLSPVAY